jgi:uncharacterized membrane protein
MAAFYLAAGTVHLIAPEQFLPIVPDFVPMPREVVLATGLCEIAGGLALLTTRLRSLAGVLLALYAAFVFPANIKHAFEGIHLPPVPDSWWYHGPRLLMQPVLVWWALFCTGVVGWPRGKRSRALIATEADFDVRRKVREHARAADVRPREARCVSSGRRVCGGEQGVLRPRTLELIREKAESAGLP